MRLPTRLCFVLLVGGAFCRPPLLADYAKPQKDAKDDSKLLEGTWKVVALEADGKKAPPEAAFARTGSDDGLQSFANHRGNAEPWFWRKGAPDWVWIGT